MSERAEQEVLDYLRRVSDHAAAVLRSDQRRDFLTRLRVRIEEARASSRTSQPEQVRKLLARFGEPTRLVERERQRLEAERHSQAGPPGHEGNPAGRAGGSASGAAAAPARTPDPAKPALRTVPEVAADSVSSTQPIPVVRDERTAPQGLQPGQGERQDPARGGEAGQERPARAAPSARPSQSVRRHRGGQAATTGPAAGGTGARARLASLLSELSRQRVLEVSALILLGLGGLFLPFPLWVFGAVLAMASPRWSYWDKWVGLATPVLVVLLAVAVAGGSQASGTAPAEAQVFLTALRTHGLTFFRAGAVVGAAYLTWRFFTAAGGRSGPRWQRGARTGR